jgi:hypothetical protein
MRGDGKRDNQGKVRVDLLPPFALEQMAKVFTFGATKYEPHNWKKGMAWSKVLASLKRHLLAFESGEDYDKETGLLHSAHIMANASFLTEYYKIYPQGDDRHLKYLNMPRIGLDIDDVVCDFIGAFGARYGLKIPNNWLWSYKMKEYIDDLYSDPDAMKEFFLGLKPKFDPSEMPFEPICYITSRNGEAKEVTEQWLEENGFPCAPVVTLGYDKDKVAVAKEYKLDIFVDDRFDTFVELNNNEICCYLYTCSHNLRYDVGHKRINSLKELL